MKTKSLLFIIFIFILFSIGLMMMKTSSSPIDTLPTVKNKTHFISLINEARKEENKRNWFEFGGAFSDGTTNTIENIDMAFSESGDFSSTNVQVNGVDEADSVKTDGKYMYQLSENELIISSVESPNEMKIAHRLTFEGGFSPMEMYIDDTFLTLIGDQDTHDHAQTTINVYALNERSNMTLIKNASVDGAYVSSRKIGEELYVISNQSIRAFEPYDADIMLLPSYSDSAFGEERKSLSWDDIHYFPDFKETSYMHITGMNLGDLNQSIHVSSYLGASDAIYASKNHLYVTTNDSYDYSNRAKTSIFKFKFHSGKTEFVANTEVKGKLLNQFSMDEHKGYFRIATTVGNVQDTQQLSTNHLLVLDENLKEVGAVHDIAPGERIYSVRFMGDRGYMVTFKKVDPLFVLDLKDPTNPTILGKLKIPGYSDYLHPYDEHHIIGIGKDTIEAKEGDFAYYQGIKMALFDVTDVNNPKEKFVEIIGDRGTESELLTNHKALLFSKEKDVFAFPVTLFERPDGHMNEHGNTHGEFTFQGAYVYGIDIDKGFTLKTRISHLTEEDMVKSGYMGNSNRYVKRILYIKNDLYTVSNDKIEAHDLNSFAKRGELLLR